MRVRTSAELLFPLLMACAITHAESIPLVHERNAIIRGLTADGALPSGVAVREALQLRFGSRCGVTRIYRLLAKERRRQAPRPPPDSTETLQAQLTEMQGRAERAEERERAH